MTAAQARDARDTAGGPAAAGGPAVVVVSYGSADLLEQNLARMTAEVDHHVVVVDNLRTDADRRAVTAVAAEHGWDLVCSAGNPGFGAAVGRGVAHAAARGFTTFLVLNPDAFVAADVVAALDDECRRHPMTLVSPRIDRTDGRSWFVGGRVDPRDGHVRRDPTLDGGGAWGWLTGACLAVHLELWERLGGFDDRYFLYWEDVDLSTRCLEAGGTLRVRADLVAEHAVGGSQEGTGKSAVYMYYNCRNRLLYAASHLDRHGQLRWLLRTPVVSARILLRVGPRQAIRSPRLMLAVARGSVAGAGLVLRGLRRPRRGPGRPVSGSAPAR